MTETLVVLMTAFAGFLFADPAFGGALTKATIAKWPLLILGFGSLSFHLVGRALMDPTRLRRAVAEVVAGWWPLIVLALFIVIGSVVARLGNDVKENFLGMGLGMLFLPMLAVSVRSSRAPMNFLKALGVVYVLTVLAILTVLFANLHVFHEEIFLAVPLGAYFLTARPLRAWQALLGLVLIAGCLYSIKNTTFLLVLVTLGACALVGVMRLFQRRRDRLGLIAQLVFAIPLAVGAVTALGLAWWRYRKELPSGNVEYRTEMYGIAWHRFLDSPIWGTGFTESSVNYFTLYRVASMVQNLPTHSDVLDLLAHGGAIAIVLWLLTVWHLGRIGFDALRRVSFATPGSDMRAWRWLFVLSLVQLGALVTYAVNPPLINPVHGFWIWASAGVMWALHRTLINPLTQPATTKVRHIIRKKKTAWA